MKKLMFVTAAAVAVVGMFTGCASSKACCAQKKCTALCACGDKKGCVKMLKNQDFYKGGTFDANGINHGGTFDSAKATQAYFDMFRRLGYPVYDALTPEKESIQPNPALRFWAVDFKKGDFMKYGMGGVIWVNEIREEYFGHDIYLLPGQSIAEHRHLPTHIKTKDQWTGKEYEKDLPCKMESWLVRFGWVWGFTTEGTPNLDQYPEVKAKLSKLLFEKDPASGKQFLNCVHVEKWVADGVAHKLAKDESWHFMMGGDEGAVVSEFANYHDGNGLRFSVPGVGF